MIIHSKTEYGQDLKYDLQSLRALPLTRGNAYQTPILNILVSHGLSKYDVVLNSGRCPYFLPKGPKFIHYIHFPVEASLVEEEHFKGLVGAIYTLPLKILYFGRAKKTRGGTFLTNSFYTMSRTRKIYSSVPEDQMHVIYPPCDIQDRIMGNDRDIDVISLGSFISDKRQLEQLYIAQELPDRKFVLVGGMKSKRYFNRCRDFIRQKGLQNVELFPNPPKAKVNELLGRSKVFLHTKRGEHFGISTVEAISSGCIPVVHDSGGLKETVPIAELRFKTLEDACLKVKSALNKYHINREVFMPLLLKNVKQFSRERFREKMGEFIFGK